MATARRRHRSARTPPSSASAPTAPPASIPNSEVVEAIDSSDEWIQQRSGIKQRRWATPEETVQMMSRRRVPRGARAGRHRRPRRSTASSSRPSRHLLQTPAVATAIAHELGTDQAAAFDISAACAGFCHGVALAADMVRAAAPATCS